MNTEANTFVVTDQMKEVRSIQLVLLKKLLEVCKRNNLRIWADSGTLIGTVREHGYIPWDDDIDMGMLRPDYDKLVEISQQEFTGRFFFQTAYSDKEYPRGHAQLRMRNTTAILPNDVDKPFHMGIFIDIFVYDVVPSDTKELETLRQQVITQKEKLFSYCDKMRFWKVFSSPVLYFRHKRIRKEISQIGFTKAYADYENLFRAHPLKEDSYIGEISFDFDNYANQQINVKDFSDTLYMPFEDTQMPVPIGYDAILTSMYGDYMRPVQEPTCHGSYLLLDTTKDYSLHIESLRKSYSHEKFIKRWKHIFDKILYYLSFGHTEVPKR